MEKNVGIIACEPGGMQGECVGRNCMETCWSGGVGAVELFDANQVIPGFAG